jgi:hypothetical protein
VELLPYEHLLIGFLLGDFNIPELFTWKLVPPDREYLYISSATTMPSYRKYPSAKKSIMTIISASPDIYP